MKVKSIRGKEYFWRPKIIDWHGKSLSKLQKSCKMVMANFWAGDVVAEEQPMPGTKMHFDFVNFTKKIIIEIQGQQHFKFNKHFHNNNIFNFVASKERDDKKKQFADLNGFIFIEATTADELNQAIMEMEK